VSKVFGYVGSGATATMVDDRELRIVEESQAALASVADLACRNDLHPNLLTAWRRQARTGLLEAVRAPRKENEVLRQCRLRRIRRHRLVPEPAGRSRSFFPTECNFVSRITGAVDPATLTAAAVAALSGGRALYSPSVSTASVCHLRTEALNFLLPPRQSA
jgi:transposase